MENKNIAGDGADCSGLSEALQHDDGSGLARTLQRGDGRPVDKAAVGHDDKVSAADFAGEKIYLMLNKPAGVVCSTVSDRHQTVFDLLPPELAVLGRAEGAVRGKRLHTVGRLDSETTGLLLLTTDGDFSNFMTRPENHIKKIYEVTLERAVDEAEQKRYRLRAAEGVILPAEKKAPEQKGGAAVIEWIFDGDDSDTDEERAANCDDSMNRREALLDCDDSAARERTAGNELAAGRCSRCRITVTEGKFHEVRRIFLALGNKVTALKRISFGDFSLPETLAEGKFIPLRPQLPHPLCP